MTTNHIRLAVERARSEARDLMLCGTEDQEGYPYDFRSRLAVLHARAIGLSADYAALPPVRDEDHATRLEWLDIARDGAYAAWVAAYPPRLAGEDTREELDGVVAAYGKFLQITRAAEDIAEAA